MNELIKYAGILIVLIGTAILAVPQFMGTMTNTLLLVGVFTIVGGVLAHIAINRRID